MFPVHDLTWNWSSKHNKLLCDVGPLHQGVGMDWQLSVKDDVAERQ